MPVRREDIVRITLGMFHRAIGVYRSRMIETINPLYWIETIIFLPRQILNYLGVTPESVIIKIAQLIYWLAAFVFGIYRFEVEEFVRGLLSKP